MQSIIDQLSVMDWVGILAAYAMLCLAIGVVASKLMVR